MGRGLRGRLRDNFIGKRSPWFGRRCRSGLLCRRGLLSRQGLLGRRGVLGNYGCGGLGRASGQGFGFIAFGQLGGGHKSPGQGKGVVVDGGEGAEKETGEVAEDGGAARRDDAGSQESVRNDR